MKRIFLLLTILCIIDYAKAQLECPQILDYVEAKFKLQRLNFLVTIDHEISQDIIEGKFFIKDPTGKQIDELAFRTWVGRLEMSNRDYQKLFKVNPKDSLYVVFCNNNFKLDTDYVYEAKIPPGMINDKYLILNIYDEKDEDNKKKYIFPGNKGYVIQVLSPGFGTLIKFLNKK